MKIEGGKGIKARDAATPKLHIQPVQLPHLIRFVPRPNETQTETADGTWEEVVSTHVFDGSKANPRINTALFEEYKKGVLSKSDESPKPGDHHRINRQRSWSTIDLCPTSGGRG